jgi:multidrug transporter EmrE-like cation transporter
MGALMEQVGTVDMGLMEVEAIDSSNPEVVLDSVVVSGIFCFAFAVTNSVAQTVEMSHAFATVVGVAMLGMMCTAYTMVTSCRQSVDGQQ